AVRALVHRSQGRRWPEQQEASSEILTLSQPREGLTGGGAVFGQAFTQGSEHVELGRRRQALVDEHARDGLLCARLRSGPSEGHSQPATQGACLVRQEGRYLDYGALGCDQAEFFGEDRARPRQRDAQRLRQVVGALSPAASDAIARVD